MKGFHWSKEDYFPYFVENLKSATLALEYLVDDLHTNKELTIKKLLDHCGSEDFLWAIVRLMSSESLRISGNSAYVFGTIAETNDGIERILGLLNNHDHPESKRILPYLISLLRTSDFECMMNAAGTIGTISENTSGRSWLISQPQLDEIIELTANLLENVNIWVSSNAALVIARISIEDEGCEKLLSHKSSKKMLLNLVSSLGCDNAGKGMNCAFAIGRICDSENGRTKILKLIEADRLINSLSLMIENHVDNGCTKNACYALSCLAANQSAHKLVIDSPNFANLINVLCRHLTSIKDSETQWFAAMLMRIFASYPNGSLKMKRINLVWDTLNELMKREDLFDDVKDEITFILDVLRPLPKPNAIRTTVKSNSEILCEWDPVILKSKMVLNYLLYKGEECVYSGEECSYLVKNLPPFSEQTFTLRIETPENGEKSLKSEATRAQTLESLPSAPLNLRLLTATTTQLKVSWDPPEHPNGILGPYYVYNGDCLIDQTAETQFVIAALQPSTDVEVAVCASTTVGKGERAVLQAQTCSLGEITPDRPIFGLIGTREILVRWQPPRVLTGKLNRYELIMNGKCVYSGVALEHQVTMLKPDTDYKFEIIAITSEGKCKSKITKVRTLKDEYDPERQPLYPGGTSNNQPNLVKEKTESTINISQEPSKSRKSSLTSTRQKSKTKIPKDLFQNSGSDNSLTSSNRKNSITNSLPHVDDSNSVKSNPISENRTPFEYKRSRFTIATANNNQVPNKQTYYRSKTLINFNQNAQKQAQTFVQPTTFTLNIKEIVPKFPLIPVNLGGSIHQELLNTTNPSMLTSQNFQNSFSLTASSTPTTSSQAIKNLQRKKEMLGLTRSSSFQSSTRQSHASNQVIIEPPPVANTNSNLKPDLQIQYKYLLNRLSREKSMQHHLGQHHQVVAAAATNTTTVADRIEPLSINRSNGFTFTKFSK